MLNILLTLFSKKRGWNYVEHSGLFYEKFTNLLILAEELKILVLHGDARTKFSLKNIKKFDLIDSFLDDDTNGQIKLPAATGILQLQDELSIPEEAVKEVDTLRITLERKGKRKPIVLKPITLEQLKIVIRKKFNVAKYSKLGFKDVAVITTEQLLEMPQDSVLVIHH